ncbi:alcohol dehydrogenase catalytic domain-containing protein [Halomarina ordinaria]|uniref:Alcohol dehydrogenase catalytic domain-containing protein n=1 Tax=Halomarina ordinaria TaxID=3033939 RepID=A0ABD5UDA7_9EURY|nr:alcohol dehydrogenase catalytic domain-containing protein [Halomarina sp. PSRA2]
MRAAAFTSLGGPDGVEAIDVPEPTVGDGQALLRVRGASVNRHDLLYLQGDFRLRENHLPFVSGVDVAGEVLDVDESVERVAPGDRVVLSPMMTCGTCQYCRDGPENYCERYHLFHGGFAERVVVDADRLVVLTDDVDLVAASTLPVAYMTAWHMLRRADVDAGDTVLIPGATGGVGVAATQLVAAMGARSICTSTSSSKLDALGVHGGDHRIVVEDAEMLPDAVAEFGPVDAVLNHLGGPFTDAGLATLRRGGRMVICGRTADRYSTFDTQDLFLEHKQVLGSTMGTQADLERVVRFVEAGQFDPPVHETYDLEEAHQAFADMENRDVVGKLVVTP